MPGMILQAGSAEHASTVGQLCYWRQEIRHRGRHGSRNCQHDPFEDRAAAGTGDPLPNSADPIFVAADLLEAARFIERADSNTNPRIPLPRVPTHEGSSLEIGVFIPN